MPKRRGDSRSHIQQVIVPPAKPPPKRSWWYRLGEVVAEALNAKQFFYSGHKSSNNFVNLLGAKIPKNEAARFSKNPRAKELYELAEGAPKQKIQTVRTEDGTNLEYMFVKNPKAKKTIFMAAGMGGGIDENINMAHWLYANTDSNVMLYSRRGYSGSSSSSIKGGEKGMYYDVKAMVGELQKRNINPKDVVAYGYSFGGTEALTAAKHFGVGKVITDRTFASPETVTKQFLAPQTFKTTGKHLRNEVASGAANKMFPKGETIQGNLKTDGLDNLGKMKSMDPKNIFVMVGEKDKLLNRNHREMLIAESGVNPKTNVARLRQGHTNFFLTGTSPEQRDLITNKLRNFINE
jgi:hypothetical protein